MSTQGCCSNMVYSMDRSLRVGPISWEVFRRDFIYRFFPREKREAKVEEFINICQGGMSLLEYSLKFTKFSKYAQSLVSNPRDKMSCFVMDMSHDVVEECRSVMLHDNIDISYLMAHAQQFDETRIKRKNREFKRAKTCEGGTSMGKLEMQD